MSGPITIPKIPGTGIERFVGFKFPDGTYRIDPDKHALWLKSVDGTASPDNLAHPVFHFIAAHAGMGYTFEQFMQLLEAPLEAGALFGEEDLQIYRPLRIGESVKVIASIVKAKSRNGAKGGSVGVQIPSAAK